MNPIRDLLGRGDDRPPAPEVASPEDVERYNMKFLENNNIEAGRGTNHDETIVGKANGEDADTLGRNVKHKADFPWLYDPSRGVRWDFDPVQLRNLGQENTWVGMMVQSITKEIAETPWTIVEADGSTETQKRLSTHPEDREPIAKELPDRTAEEIHGLLMKPNPDHTWHDMVEMWYGDYLEVGSMTAVKAFHRSAYSGEEFTADPRTVKPRALQASAPEVWTKDYSGKTGLLEGFWQFDNHKSPGTGASSSGGRSRGMNDPTFFDSTEVMWTDHAPRTNRRYGMPPTLLVKAFLESLDLAIGQEQQYLSRGSLPSGAAVFEEWDREELKEWKEENAENISGKPWKWLTIAGKGGDFKFEPFTYNFSEMEFVERMKWYARVVASAFQVPTAVVGIEPERINYNTFQGERENFENNTLGPYLMKGERWINYNLIQPHWGPNYRFEFKPGLSETTRDMISGRVRSEFDSNIRTRNEARREIGLDEVDDEQDGFKDDVTEGSDDGGLEDMLASAGDSGNSSESVRKDEPLRNTDDWHAFDIQPSDVEPLADEIAADVDDLFERVLDDPRVLEIIDRLAVDDDDETEKSLSSLHRRLREIFDESDIVEQIERALRDKTAEAARDALENAIEVTDEDPEIDVERITEQLQAREVEFADSFANRLSEDIRSTVGGGWREGKNSREIAQDIADQADISEGWHGAERIARQEMHIAAGEARSEFAEEIGKVEIWNTSDDHRVRPAHEAMESTWKWPGDSWVVEYENRGVEKESVPGNSEPGIGCRCGVLLRDRSEVDASDYAGDGSPER